MKITRTEYRRMKGGKRLFVNTLIADGDWCAPITVGRPRADQPIVLECGKDGSGRAVQIHLSHLDALMLVVKLRDAAASLKAAEEEIERKPI